jgi:phosphotransferase system  glucose/maltose/N-acetylglucosamine-specific IIC component
MMFLQVAEEATKPENSWTFIIISEVVITAIVFVGAYYIFKPVFLKDAEKREEERQQAEDSDNEQNSKSKDQ